MYLDHNYAKHNYPSGLQIRVHTTCILSLGSTYRNIELSLSFSFFDNIKIIHFLGSVKPWAHQYNQAKDTVVFYPGSDASQYGAETFVKKWWQVYCSGLPTEPTQTYSEVRHWFL